MNTPHMLTNLHHLYLEMRLTLFKIQHLEGRDFVVVLTLLIFACVFLVVGLMRSVEFQGLGFSSFRRRVLIGLHSVGVILFSLAMAIFGLDTERRYVTVIGVIFGAAMILLLPAHIYLALIRRIKIRDSTPQPPKK